MIIIDLNTLFVKTAKLSKRDTYIQKINKLARNEREVVLTGAAPVWLYLIACHTLHGKVRKLVYKSPVTGDVEIFDHNPFEEE